VPSPTDHRGNIRKVLHGCTTAFLPLYKSIKSCIKILRISDMVRTEWHFCPHFCTTLKSLTNYSGAMKSVIQKFYTQHIYNHRTNRLLWNFFSPSLKWSKSCAQSMVFEFSEKKIRFWPNSNTNVAPPCGIVQVSVQTFETAFFSCKECWNPHQNRPTNGDNIAIWMTKPLSVINYLTTPTVWFCWSYQTS